METLTKHSDDELMKMLGEKRESLRAFRFGATGGKTKNVKEGKTLRREIARILTELGGRRLKIE